MRRRRLAGLLGLLLQLAATRAVLAQPCDPMNADAAAIAAARAAADAACDCNRPGQNHGEYVRCTMAAIDGSGLRRECRGALKRCYARSTCGRAGFVTCCRTRASGVTSCTIKPDAAHCTAPQGGSACAGAYATCCDACTSMGCTPTTTTTTTMPPPTCASGPFPDCGGTCGAGEACFASPLSAACECFPDGTQPCGDSRYPVCNGTCPANEQCGLLSVLGGCGCVPAGTTPCGEAGGACGLGSCPTGQECGLLSTPALTYCTCAPAGVPCCAGGVSCGPGQVCSVAPGLCLCFPP